MGTKSAWTPERRANQATFIRQTQPWKHSTGPRTTEGKATSSRNAYAGDWYHETLAKIADARSSALATIGYTRMRKSVRTDTRRT